jgi:hypothetical protein
MEKGSQFTYRKKKLLKLKVSMLSRETSVEGQRANGGIVVGDERTSQRAKEVVDIDNDDDIFVVQPMDLV